VERRRDGLTVGIARLAATVGDLVGVPLERFCDEVLVRQLEVEHEDDVALLALRVRA